MTEPNAAAYSIKEFSKSTEKIKPEAGWGKKKKKSETELCLFQAPNKLQKLNRNKKSFSLIFHHFSPFTCSGKRHPDRQSVILWLDKGDLPENLHTVCPC